MKIFDHVEICAICMVHLCNCNYFKFKDLFVTQQDAVVQMRCEYGPKIGDKLPYYFPTPFSDCLNACRPIMRISRPIRNDVE